MNEIIKQLIPQIYSDAAQPALKEVGKILENAVSFVGIPFLGMGYLSKKTNIYFEKNLLSFANKMEQVPTRERQEPLLEIAVPILQKLSFTTSEEIADLFNSLLVGASDIRQQHNVFPSFADIVSQLSIDEAKIIKHLDGRQAIGYCCLHREEAQTQTQTLYYNLQNEVDFIFRDNLELYLSDMERMGIIESSWLASSLDLPEFSIIPKVFQFERIIETEKKRGVKITVSNHNYDITEFGEAFIKACNYIPIKDTKK